jgi:hypothetical protein
LLESAVAFKKAREAIMQRMKLDFPNH